APVRIGGTMANRADDAKNSVDQHPGSKKQHECRGSHDRMCERDHPEDNCSNTPQYRNPPMTFYGFDKHDAVLATANVESKHRFQSVIKASHYCGLRFACCEMFAGSNWKIDSDTLGVSALGSKPALRASL